MKKCSSNNCYLRYHEQGGGLPVFKGRLLHHRQRGFGLFSSIARFVVPIGKKLIKNIAPQPLKGSLITKYYRMMIVPIKLI